METLDPGAVLLRAAAPALERAMRVARVVVLLGARQTGKTTLVRSLPQLGGRPYLTLDDFDLWTQAQADPEAVVARAPALVLKAPRLYWCDTALALHQVGETEPRGAHLGNLVLVDLLARRDVQARRPEILSWRTAAGQEMDVVDEYHDLADGALLLVAPRGTAACRAERSIPTGACGG